MSEAATVTRFQMGAAIPEWLLAAEPMQPGAPRGAGLRFGCDVDVIETADSYVVIALPGQAHQPLIADAGMAAHHIFAPSKVARMVQLVTPILREAEARAVSVAQVDAAARTYAAHLADVRQEHERNGAPPQPYFVPRRPWWRRLLGI